MVPTEYSWTRYLIFGFVIVFHHYATSNGRRRACCHSLVFTLLGTYRYRPAPLYDSDVNISANVIFHRRLAIRVGFWARFNRLLHYFGSCSNLLGIVVIYRHCACFVLWRISGYRVSWAYHFRSSDNFDSDFDFVSNCAFAGPPCVPLGLQTGCPFQHQPYIFGFV
mmetsp:Transcript_20382/g.42251  ORF Transcript_20382/g.42251 Transcript_20382/m.42251 type:complete len:166 (-) Transcript_20382:487-984(-)